MRAYQFSCRKQVSPSASPTDRPFSASRARSKRAMWSVGRTGLFNRASTAYGTRRFLGGADTPSILPKGQRNHSSATTENWDVLVFAIGAENRLICPFAALLRKC